MNIYALLCLFLGLMSLPAAIWYVRRRRDRLLSRLQERDRRWSSRFREDAATFRGEIWRKPYGHSPGVDKETGAGAASTS